MKTTGVRQMLYRVITAVVWWVVACSVGGGALAGERCRHPVTCPRVEEAGFATILHRSESSLAIFQLVENPHVFVIDFPDLDAQGEALNRVAALIEKRDAPKKRLLNDHELASAIAHAGRTPATYFLAHDYRLPDLARAFTLAEHQKLALNRRERCVVTLLKTSGTARTEGEYSIISISAVGPSSPPQAKLHLSTSARAALLRHEVSHGEYFTNGRYFKYCWDFWHHLPPDVQQVFRDGLGDLGYDASQEDLMVNETQAYLWELDNAAMIDMNLRQYHTSIESLRKVFLNGLDASRPPISQLFTLKEMRVPCPYNAPGARKIEKITEPPSSRGGDL